jgi:uncharacterized FlaG/YvyC family protein
MSFFEGSCHPSSGGDMNVSSIGNLAAYINAPTQLAVANRPTQDQKADQKALIQALKTVNAAGLVGEENEVTFRIDRAAQIAVVRIVNKNTGELVQQIPTEQVLKMAEESNGR